MTEKKVFTLSKFENFGVKKRRVARKQQRQNKKKAKS